MPRPPINRKPKTSTVISKEEIQNLLNVSTPHLTRKISYFKEFSKPEFKITSLINILKDDKALSLEKLEAVNAIYFKLAKKYGKKADDKQSLIKLIRKELFLESGGLLIDYKSSLFNALPKKIKDKIKEVVKSKDLTIEKKKKKTINLLRDFFIMNLPKAIKILNEFNLMFSKEKLNESSLEGLVFTSLYKTANSIAVQQKWVKPLPSNYKTADLFIKKIKKIIELQIKANKADAEQKKKGK